jgi:hypothetical protein
VSAARDRKLGGLLLAPWCPELEGCLLVCATEVHGDADIARPVEVLS